MLSAPRLLDLGVRSLGLSRGRHDRPFLRCSHLAPAGTRDSPSDAGALVAFAPRGSSGTGRSQ